MSIPNTLAFARNINLANTTLSPTLLLHCGVGISFVWYFPGWLSVLECEGATIT